MPISAIRPIVGAPHPMRRAGDVVIGKDGVVGSTAATDARTETVALTRTEPPLRTAPVSSRAARPDASFIAHLIATAEQAPQTRPSRRAAVADVEAAYRAVANTNMTGSAGGSTQRLI